MRGTWGTHSFVVGEGYEKQKQVPIRLRSSATADDVRSGQAFGSAEKRFAQDDNYIVNIYK
jgi:hypothetical protein